MPKQSGKNQWNDWNDDHEKPEALLQMAPLELAKNILLKDIEIFGGRKLDIAKVEELECSIRDQGFLQPIHVYPLAGSRKGKYGLSSGHHRYEALRNLGYKDVLAFVISRKQAKAWRDAENMYRNNLSPLEFSQAVVRYAANRDDLLDVKNKPQKGGKQPNDKGIKRIAKATGFNRRRVSAAFNHVALPSSVKSLVLENRKLNKVTTLNALVKMADESDQLAYLKKVTKAAPSVVKNAARTKVKRPKACAVKIPLPLQAAWSMSRIRPLFEEQTAEVKGAFIKRYLKC